MNPISLVLIIAVAYPISLQAATPIPSWDGDPGATRAGYDFSTDSTTPAPVTLDNDYGTPSAEVVEGDFSDSWQNPVNPLDLHGVNDDGAWDIGQYQADDGFGNPAGYIDVSVPIALGVPPGGSSYSVEVVVYAVAYNAFGLYLEPDLEIEGGTVSGLTTNNEFIANEEGLGQWRGVTWTATVDDVLSDEVSFRFVSSTSGLAVIDEVEIFTRRVETIPEPTSSLLILSTLAMALLGNRRR